MARRFISSLTDTDRQALAEVHQYSQKRALRCRAHAILLSDQGYTITQISDILEVGRNTLTIWFQKWEASGLDELVDKPRSGRHPILDERDRARLQALVEEHPHQLRTLQARLQEETGKTFSTDTLRRALKKNDNSFKRIRHSLKGRRDEADFRNTQGLLKVLQEREDPGKTHEKPLYDGLRSALPVGAHMVI